MKKERLPYILVIAALIVLFFTQRNYLPTFVYVLLATGLGIYFFPVKMILEIVKDKKVKTVIVSILSNYLYGLMLCAPILLLYVPDGQNIGFMFSIIALINGVTGLVYFIFSIDVEKAVMHITMNMFYWVLH